MSSAEEDTSYESASGSPKATKVEVAEVPKDMDGNEKTETHDQPRGSTSDAPEAGPKKWVVLLDSHRYNLTRITRFKRRCLADLVQFKFQYTKKDGLKYKSKKPDMIICSSAPTNITMDPNHGVHELLSDYNRCDGIAASMVINDGLLQEQRRIGHAIDEINDSLAQVVWYCIQNEEDKEKEKRVTTDTVKDIVGHHVEIADASRFQVVLYGLNEAPQQPTFAKYLEKDKDLIIRRLSDECRGRYNPEVLEKAVKEVRRLVPRSSDRERSALRSHLWARPVLVTFETEEWRKDYLRAAKLSESKNVSPGKTIQQRDTIKRLRRECKEQNDARCTPEEFAFQWVLSKCGKRKFLILDQTSEEYRRHLLSNDAFETYNHKDKVNIVMGLQPTYQAMKRRDVLAYKTSSPQYMCKEAKAPTGFPPSGWTNNAVGDTVMRRIKDWSRKEIEEVRNVARNDWPAAANAADLQ